MPAGVLEVAGLDVDAELLLLEPELELELDPPRPPPERPPEPPRADREQQQANKVTKISVVLIIASDQLCEGLVAKVAGRLLREFNKVHKRHTFILH